MSGVGQQHVLPTMLLPQIGVLGRHLPQCLSQRHRAARLMKPVSPCAVDYVIAVLQDSKAIKPNRIRILGSVTIMAQLRR